MKRFSIYIIAVNLIFSMGASILQAKESFHFSVNGDFSNRYIRGVGDINSLYKYKAQIEDEIESESFKASIQEEKEFATKELLNREIRDIAMRIELIINDIQNSADNNETNDYYFSENAWNDIELKLKSLRVAADVLRDSDHPDLESLIVNGLTEVHNIKMINEDGSLCDEEPPEGECPSSKMIFLVDLIEKVKNEKVKNETFQMIEGFANLQAIPQSQETCLTSQVQIQDQKKDLSMFCGMTKSNKVRKAIRSGLSYFSSGNQDPTHSCRAIKLYLTRGNGQKYDVQLDSSRESYVEDSFGKRIHIGPMEFKMLQENIK